MLIEMTPERWHKVSHLYNAALACDAKERTALLNSACAGDPALRREVESLLAQGAPPTAFMDEPALEVVGRMLDQIRPLPVGAELGAFRIEALLGAGGMGEVYRAHDTRLHRTVAIKVLPREFISDPEHRRRFLHEARAASALNHPAIVTLHDMASVDGTDLLVMEYVPGRSLDRLISAKGLPLIQALGYAQQLGGALAAAHAAGIVHRDIKPANVIVTPQGQVKVLDFGLAKLLDRAPQGPESETRTAVSLVTEPGRVMGTVAYMSPEQASGRDLDHRYGHLLAGYCSLRNARGPASFPRQVATRHDARNYQQSRAAAVAAGRASRHCR